MDLEKISDQLSEVVGFLRRIANAMEGSNGVEAKLSKGGVESIVVGKKNRKSSGVSGGGVWDAYVQAYRGRYGSEPLRNAQVNAQCKKLCETVGQEAAVSLICYYVGRQDAFYVHAKHPIGLCLLNAQKLITEKLQGVIVTMTDARRIESHDQTDRVIREYAVKQGGNES